MCARSRRWHGEQIALAVCSWLAPFLWLLGVLGQVLAEPVQALLPALASLRDPILSSAKRLRLHVAGAHASDLFRADQAACLQYVQMLDDGRQRHGKRLRELADRGRAECQTIDHRAARRIRERVEREVERDSLLVKHSLKYYTWRDPPEATGLAGGGTTALAGQRAHELVDRALQLLDAGRLHAGHADLTVDPGVDLA